MRRNITAGKSFSLRYFFTLFVFCFFSICAHAQLTISGTVFDNSKINFVEGVRVIGTGGSLAFTDSMGRYSIKAAPGDSLFFMYNNKPTQKFALNTITNQAQFDIALPMPIKTKYHMLKEVVVFSKTYGEDSVENRETYDKAFSYQKPGIKSSMSNGTVGMDLDQLINMFRFRHNREMKAFQLRLENREQDKYIDYRFSKRTVGRITQLSGALLDTFLIWYRPTYEFVTNSSEITFNQYVLNASYEFRRIKGLGEMKKEE